MIVLDTNVVSELMRPQLDMRVDACLKWINRPLTTTTVTIAEIVCGLKRLPLGRRRDELTESFHATMNRLVILVFDAAAGHRAGEFRALRESAGYHSESTDMMIAAVAALNEAPLITRNTKDFSLLPIEVINPWQGH